MCPNKFHRPFHYFVFYNNPIAAYIIISFLGVSCNFIGCKRSFLCIILFFLSIICNLEHSALCIWCSISIFIKIINAAIFRAWFHNLILIFLFYHSRIGIRQCFSLVCSGDCLIYHRHLIVCCLYDTCRHHPHTKQQ